MVACNGSHGKNRFRHIEAEVLMGERPYLRDRIIVTGIG